MNCVSHNIIYFKCLNFTNLINYFLTDKYERYLNNSFGANLQTFIFEQINNDNLSFLKEDIQSKINQYFSDRINQKLTKNLN